MDMRERIATALKDAMKMKEQERLSTLRLINAAIKDREIALRGTGDGGSVGDAEVLAILGELTGQTPRTTHGPKRPGDQRRTSADTSRIRSEHGWAPRVSLEDGLRAQWQWVSTRVPLA